MHCSFLPGRTRLPSPQTMGLEFLFPLQSFEKIAGLLAFVLGHELRQRLHGIRHFARNIAVHLGQFVCRLAGAFFGELTLVLSLMGGGDPGQFFAVPMFEKSSPNHPGCQHAPQ